MNDVNHMRVLFRRLEVALLKFSPPTVVSQARYDALKAKRSAIASAWHARYPHAARLIDNALIRTGYVG